MTDPFKVENVKLITTGLGTGRADYTTDVISNVSVTVQSERLVIFSNLDTVNVLTDTLPTIATPYASNWQEVGTYKIIRGGMWANQAGTIYIEQTNENSTTTPIARIQTSQAYVASSEAGGFVVDIVHPYVRVRFVPTVNPSQFVSWVRLAEN